MNEFKLIDVFLFQPPRKPRKWNGIRNATRYGNVCPQSQYFQHYASFNLQNEDCLYLNVYAPPISNEVCLLLKRQFTVARFSLNGYCRHIPIKRRSDFGLELCSLTTDIHTLHVVNCKRLTWSTADKTCTNFKGANSFRRRYEQDTTYSSS
jgi:Carboxylesterase family